MGSRHQVAPGSLGPGLGIAVDSGFLPTSEEHDVRWTPSEKDRVAMAQSIQRCLVSARSTAPLLHGRILVEVRAGPEGISGAKSSGLSHAALETCIGTALTGLKPAKLPAKPDRVRCSFALGQVDVDRAPTVTIDKNRVTVGGEVVDPSNTKSLSEQLSRARHVDGVDYQVLIVRATPAAPGGLVNRVIAAAAKLGFGDVVFQARDGQRWRSLYSRPLPSPDELIEVEPWGEEAVQISVLVTGEAIWVGLSRVSDFTRVSAKGGDVTRRLDLVLRRHKRSSYLHDNARIEVAMAADARYESFVTAVKRAREAGFTDVRFYGPEHVSAKPAL
jgi:biopolymer transport protein ExbD